MKIEKDMIIADLLEQAPEKAEILTEAGMHCINCVIAHGETIEEACQAHGIDVDELIDQLNK